MVSQPRHWSFIEAVTGTAIGYAIAILTQLLTFPILGLKVTFSQNLVLGLIFTGVSIVRGYYVRRLFNYIHKRQAKKILPAIHDGGGG